MLWREVDWSWWTIVVADVDLAVIKGHGISRSSDCIMLEDCASNLSISDWKLTSVVEDNTIDNIDYVTGIGNARAAP